MAKRPADALLEVSGAALSEDRDSCTFRRLVSSQSVREGQKRARLSPVSATREAADLRSLAAIARGYIAVALATRGPPRGDAISALIEATSRSGSSAARISGSDFAQRPASVPSTRSLIVGICDGCIEKLRSPMPSKSSVNAGSPAISPQTLM